MSKGPRRVSAVDSRMNTEQRRKAHLFRIIGEAKAKLIAAIAPFSRQAAAELDAPRFKAALEAYGNTLLEVADAAKAFADSHSAEDAERLSAAALAFRDVLIALQAEGEEIERRARNGDLH
jgi:hypothetical protein